MVTKVTLVERGLEGAVALKFKVQPPIDRHRGSQSKPPYSKAVFEMESKKKTL